MTGLETQAGRTGHPEIAIALTDGRSLARATAAEAAGPLFEALRLAPPPSANGIAAAPVARLHLGNEFCERLIPATTLLRRAIGLAEGAGMALTLATPSVPDARLAHLRRLFGLLPGGAEVVVNDYGVLRLLRRDFPALEPVAGRQLCKAVKDPRLPSEQWARLNPGGVDAPGFAALLERFGIRRIELDLPPYARPADLRAGRLALTVHAPFGYALRGRICRIGSLRFDGPEKFRPGQLCGKECLRYACALSRPADRQGRDLESVQRGNSVFYRHDAAMTGALWQAASSGWIDRIVLAGDWPDGAAAPVLTDFEATPGRFGWRPGQPGEEDRHADHRPH